MSSWSIPGGTYPTEPAIAEILPVLLEGSIILCHTQQYNCPATENNALATVTPTNKIAETLLFQ
jgi:hypothetical protein